MTDNKVPFFQPFASIKEGFDELFEVIKKIDNIDEVMFSHVSLNAKMVKKIEQDFDLDDDGIPL